LEFRAAVCLPLALRNLFFRLLIHPSVPDVAFSPHLSTHPAHAVAADYSGRSNLALAFLWLPREKRADMNAFYTFCRLVDDIADSSDLPLAVKREQLAAWRGVVNSPGAPGLSANLLADEVRALMDKYHIAPELMLEIIAGVEMDLDGASYETFEALRAYCYRVASAVGLVSIEIFGYRDPGCRQYAIDLGIALQLTNIIRDVGTDLDNGGRIYLPLEDLARFGYSEDNLRQRVHDARFTALMTFEAERAEDYYQRAVRVLPPIDRRAMVAAEIMRAVYHKILVRARSDGYRVLSKRYRLNKLMKLATLLGAALRNRWTPAPRS
jgi:phytoene synthase